MSEAECPFDEGEDPAVPVPGGTASIPDVLDTSFRSALRRLDEAGLLARVSRTVDPDLEVAGLMKRHDAAAALLFESVKDHDVPVVGNVFATPESSETAMGTGPGPAAGCAGPGHPHRCRARAGRRRSGSGAGVAQGVHQPG